MKKFILAVVAMSVFTTAQASFLIEPYLGTHFSSEIEIGSYEDDISGIGMGARAGWQNLGLQLGVNYKMASFDFDKSTTDADYSHMGVFVGYEFPVLVRVWAEYILSSELDFDNNGGKYEDASGTTLGFGYTGLPFVAVNFEITNVSYGEYNGSSLSSDLDLSSYMLSVSLPLTF